MGRRRIKPVEEKEFIAPSPEAQYALFDVLEEIQFSVTNLMEQKKTKTKDMADRIKDFADKHGCKPKEVRQAFKYYLDKKRDKAGADQDSPLWTLMSIADQISAEDYKPEDYSFADAAKN